MLLVTEGEYGDRDASRTRRSTVALAYDGVDKVGIMMETVASTGEQMVWKLQ